MLIKKKVLDAFSPEVIKKIGFPFNMRQREDGYEDGEDLSFCRRAKFIGFEVWCDPTFILGHVGHNVFDKRHYNASLDLGMMEKIEYTNKIDGWMTEGELNWLYRKAKTMDSIIEIGSWKGKSTHAFLSACKGQVTAIDHFKGSNEKEHKGVKNLYKEFMKNVGEFKNLKVLKMSSDEAVNKVKEADMTFIDGSHSYDQVKKDIQNYLPKTKKLICGHDYNWESVRQAVNETLGNVQVAETLWFKEII
jgi:precorrin-6B methylase 2